MKLLASGAVLVATALMAITSSTAVAHADQKSNNPDRRPTTETVWVSNTSPTTIKAAARRQATIGVSTTAVTWASCGLFDSDDKVVRLYPMSWSPAVSLQCGNSGYGYRHILESHRTQFEALAAGTFQNWRDLADDAISAAFADPDHSVVRSANDTLCRDRLLYLVNVKTGDTVGTHMFLVITSNSTNTIITSYPSSC